MVGPPSTPSMQKNWPLLEWHKRLWMNPINHHRSQTVMIVSQYYTRRENHPTSRTSHPVCCKILNRVRYTRPFTVNSTGGESNTDIYNVTGSGTSQKIVTIVPAPHQ